MKKMISIFLIGLCLPASLAASMHIRCDLTSRYIWRGFDLNPDNRPALQPSITLGFGDTGLFLDIWSSISFEAKERGEIDLTLFYDFMISEDVSLVAGFTHYGFYFQNGFSWRRNTTQEFYLSGGLPSIFLSPAVSLFYDINRGSGFYGRVAGELPLRLSRKVRPLLSAALGYNRRLFIPDEGWSDLDLGLTLPLRFDRIEIAPYIFYTFVFLDSVNPEDEFRAGIAVMF